MISTSSLWRLTELLASLAVNGAVLGWSFEAYRRTKLRGFAFWICSCTVGIIMITTWYGVSELHAQRLGSPPPSWYPAYSVLYRISFIANTIVSGIGSVLIIRHVLGETPPNGQGIASDGAQRSSDAMRG